jgi:AcrR family transcriptional regulator
MAAARQIFATHGYERATVRLVAALAGTAPSLVIRYFGSKDGLFAAAVTFDLRLPDMAAVPRAELGKRLTRHFLLRWEEQASGGELGALLRAAVSASPARDRMIEIFQHQLQASVADLCSGDRPEDRAALIASQFLGLALTRYVLALPAAAGLAGDTIIENVGVTIQHYLTGDLVNAAGKHS